MNRLDALCEYFERLGPGTLGELDRHYAADTWFKDPFHEVQGREVVRAILQHTFRKLPDARFLVQRRFSDDDRHGVILWEMRFTMPMNRQPSVIQGTTHIEFDTDGKVIRHRDYWDAAGDLYGRLPLLGWLMRVLARHAAAST